MAHLVENTKCDLAQNDKKSIMSFFQKTAVLL